MAARCDLCGQAAKRLVCDHDYQTDEIRGFLCDRCNAGLGMLGDNVERIQAVLAYLMAPRSGLLYSDWRREMTRRQQRTLRARRKTAPEWSEWREREKTRNRERMRVKLHTLTDAEREESNRRQRERYARRTA